MSTGTILSTPLHTEYASWKRPQQLDAAAGEAEEQVEDAALAGQVDDVVDEGGLGGDHLPDVLRVVLRHSAVSNPSFRSARSAGLRPRPPSAPRPPSRAPP